MSMAGRKHTAASREKMSQSQKGRKHTAEAREKMSAANKGRSKSPEQRERMSAAQKLVMARPGARERLAEANYRRSPELIAQIAAKHRGKTISEAHRAANRSKLTGVPHTPERREKIAATKAAKKLEREALRGQ